MERGKTTEALDDLILRLMQAESVDFDTAVKIVKGMIVPRLWAIEESKKKQLASFLVNNGGSMTDKNYDPYYAADGSNTASSLRDYFAAKAMQGILANPGQLDNVNDEAAKWVARDAYTMADAMLKARG